MGMTSRWGMELVKRVLPRFQADWPGVSMELTQASAGPLRREALLLAVPRAWGSGGTAPLTLRDLEARYGGADFLLSRPGSSVRHLTAGSGCGRFIIPTDGM